ncbi:MAG: hypothetical protein WBC51_06330 [Vicinamibacterales bacterium]
MIMSIAQDFISELDYEMPATRRLIERVPADKGRWKPHPKSSALGHLAQLVVRLPGVMTNIVKGIDLNLADGPGYTFETTEVLLGEFDKHVRELREALLLARDEDFPIPWRLMYGPEVIDTAPRKAVLRNTINHFVHHRAQLTVYLRMNDIALPQLYGPTADEGR